MFWTCKPVLRCRLIKVHIWLGKPQGAWILEWGGDGNGEIRLRATWDQGGRDPITARKVPNKKRGNGREAKRKEKAESKGIAP
jgi:hypothetical protein